MIRQPISIKKRVILGVIAILTVIVAYAYLSHNQHEINPDDATMPTWNQMFHGIERAISPHPRTHERWLLMDAKATGIRLAFGLCIAITGAIILGLMMGCIGFFQGFLQPFFAFASKMTPTAMIAVFFVLAGTDMNMYLAMIVFGIMPTLALTIAMAVRDVPEQLVHKAYTLGASHFEVVFSVIARQIAPRILDSIRLSIGPALIYLIAAEMISSDVGFGYRIRLQSRLLDMSLVYPYIKILAGFGFTADWTLKFLQNKLYPWFGRDQI